MSTSLDERHVRVDDYQARAESAEFGAQVWQVFAQLAQPRSANEIAAILNISSATVATALGRLAAHQLVRVSVAGDEATPAPAAAPAVSRPAAVVAPVSGAPAVFLRLASDRAVRAPAGPVIHVRISQNGPVAIPGGASPAPVSAVTTEPAPSADTRPFKLRPVLDAIGASVGGGLPGQLLVYKIFLQLPPDLLQAAGLHSLGVVDDQFTVGNPQLRSAIADAARVHANLDIETLATT